MNEIGLVHGLQDCEPLGSPLCDLQLRPQTVELHDVPGQRLGVVCGYIVEAFVLCPAVRYCDKYTFLLIITLET